MTDEIKLDKMRSYLSKLEGAQLIAMHNDDDEFRRNSLEIRRLQIRIYELEKALAK